MRLTAAAAWRAQCAESVPGTLSAYGDLDGPQETCDNASIDGEGLRIGGYDGADGHTGDQMYRDEVLAARVMTPEEKLLAGPQLFDFACRIALDGIPISSRTS